MNTYAGQVAVRDADTGRTRGDEPGHRHHPAQQARGRAGVVQ
jgi:hypothetical protein